MKISEVAEKVELTPVTLRYYEKVGLLPNVKRKNGVRHFAESDLEWINFIKCMRQVKIPVKDLVVYTELLQQGTDTKPLRRQILVDELHRLEEDKRTIQQSIERLKAKIDLYDQGKIK
ncbi:MerR family transcriptional regulator [Lactobacillus xylocopicola]|uniref:MerR family transcriptional regulator n=1 Tax=Lactobacillus xylocopicola TaxID=2976676 RepID=A0ABM8BF08_9LACO|nr:MerR family transcriptional regulator [Lactobacillus xylocopicola]BDR59791.1 MerR family transcriptional regulator [Lactobacillus xylocopicola]